VLPLFLNDPLKLMEPLLRLWVTMLLLLLLLLLRLRVTMLLLLLLLLLLLMLLLLLLLLLAILSACDAGRSCAVRRWCCLPLVGLPSCTVQIVHGLLYEKK
jgi:hypothetical protein